MLYVQQSLAPDEELIYIGTFHWWYNVQAAMSIVWGVFICALIIGLSVYAQTNLGINLSAYPLPRDAGTLDLIRALHPGIKLVSFLMFLMGLLKFAQMMVNKATTEIAITTSRLIYKRGLVARVVKELSIDRIEGVNVVQGVLGRIFDFGRIVVRGMGVGEMILPPIERPIVFRKAIEKARTS
jgi:hypothetical protein